LNVTLLTSCMTLCMAFRMEGFEVRIIEKLGKSSGRIIFFQQTANVSNALLIRRRGGQSTIEFVLSGGCVVFGHEGVEIIAFIPKSSFGACVERVAHGV
jgi:hypothetical protein